jgi:hypothetical protein
MRIDGRVLLHADRAVADVAAVVDEVVLNLILLGCGLRRADGPHELLPELDGRGSAAGRGADDAEDSSAKRESEKHT